MAWGVQKAWGSQGQAPGAEVSEKDQVWKGAFSLTRQLSQGSEAMGADKTII